MDTSLKNRLIQISKQKDENLLEKDYFDLSLEMLKNLGSTDSELRDDLIYSLLATWIEEDLLQSKYLLSILNICLDNEHLKFKLGYENDDSVFMRTFSALVIELVLEKNNKSNFLNKETISNTKKIFFDYYEKEIDLRGYTGIKGWAHSTAHGADVLVELAKCNALDVTDLQKILSLVEQKICQGKYAYCDGEADRLCVAIQAVFDRHLLSKQEILTWLQRIQEHITPLFSIENFHMKLNIHSFFRALYFHIKKSVDDYSILNDIEQLELK